MEEKENKDDFITLEELISFVNEQENDFIIHVTLEEQDESVE
jgi:hypothetical protein